MNLKSKFCLYLKTNGVLVYTTTSLSKYSFKSTTWHMSIHNFDR